MYVIKAEYLSLPKSLPPYQRPIQWGVLSRLPKFYQDKQVALTLVQGTGSLHVKP